MSYLKELEANLKSMPELEKNEAIFYYEQYLFEGKLTDGQAVAEFGTPKNLARRLVADYFMDESRGLPIVQKQSSFTLTKMVVLGICASPILMPLMIAVLALIFALVVTFAALIFSLFVIIFAFGFAAVACLLGGAFIMTQSVAGGFFYLGVSIAVLGILGLLWPIVINVIRWLKQCLSKIITWIGSKTISLRGIHHDN